MFPDLTAVDAKELTLLEWTIREGTTPADLRRWTIASLDTIVEIGHDLDDGGVTFVPYDPDAYDRYAATEAERAIGWSFAHQVAHVTATSEEWATYGSILARGIAYPAEPRLRYETPYQTLLTRGQVDQRLAESRRIRLGYLDAMPDVLHLDTRRGLSPRFLEQVGEMNAIAGFLFGLKHELGHHNQMRETVRQVKEERERKT